jgi:hypothetical protein
VYAWPFPIGPECEVACADDEQVVMCPAWLVGDRLGPGRHLWRTPDPTRPVSAFFVLTAPVEVSFDMTTMFLIPVNGMPVRLRAVGSLQVRCGDPGLLIAQFVGLPFDRVNDGILRSVSRSVERMLARLLTRRVVMSSSPLAVTEPGMLASIIEELVAYNPTAGAVFGVELIRVGHLTIVADDGSSPQIALPPDDSYQNGNHAAAAAAQIAQRVGDVSLVETARGRPGSDGSPRRQGQSSPEITPPQSTASGEIQSRAPSQHEGRGHAVEVPHSTDDITQPGVHTPVPGALKAGQRRPDATPTDEARGAIVGIGMSAIGHGASTGGSAMGSGMGSPMAGMSPTLIPGLVSGEIGPRVPPGARVLVPGPNGLMQSATVRQLLQGYYELEVGSSGETIWVPIAGVVPE